MASSFSCLFIFICAQGHVQHNVDDKSFNDFVNQYNVKQNEYNSPIQSLIDILTSIEHWSVETNQALPEPSNYPYFHWMPFYQNSSIPTKTNVAERVHFNPLNCFGFGTMHTEYDPVNTSQIIIHLELSNKLSATCRCALVFGTIARLTIAEFIEPGPHKLYFPLDYTQLSISDQYDLEHKGIRVLALLSDLSQTIADAVETASLFECMATRSVLPNCAKKSRLFLKEYANVDMQPRNTSYNVWQHINTSLIQSGDFLGVIRLDGLDPVLGMYTLTYPNTLIANNKFVAWAMGSQTGHTVVAIRDPKDDTLYITESTSNSSYWPVNGIQKTEYNEWMTQANLAGYQVVWLPLTEVNRQKFNVTAAMKFFESVDTVDYGFQTMLYSWIDTLEDNYPCLPPDFEMCLTWGTMELALGLFERWIDGFSVMINPGMNKRLNTSNFTLSEMYYQAHLNGLETEQLMSIVEEDKWMYQMQKNDGSYVDAPAMVCCMFVCQMWKAGGLFEDLGNDNINCNEFTNFDDYGLNVFDVNMDERPGICKEADPNNRLCQLMGSYEMMLNSLNTITPHQHMAEKCASQPPDYSRTPDC